MSAVTPVEILRQGPDAWNDWRTATPNPTPDLRGCDLEEFNLAGANLSGADLTGADLFSADLTRANLKMATLSGADLSNANLHGADLYKADMSRCLLVQAKLDSTYMVGVDLRECDARGAKFVGANLSESNLSGAALANADMTGCDLSSASIIDADLSHANLSEAKLVGLIHGSFGSMSGHYHGIRGLESSYGNRIFVRDAADQDFLGTMRRHIESTPPGPARAIRKVLFRGWGAIGYGRSLGPPTMYALGLAGIFGCIYSLDMWLDWGLMDYSKTAHSPFTPFYYSIVTYTTLGFGDITPSHWLGEIIIVIEVVLGYLTLGLLLSILANTVARRS
ncbi:MAG: hypothetical protein ACJA0V_002499 [Planctomycetota bacterium]|jgi:hypothetical protein